MSLKSKLPVSYLLFTNRGRLNRLEYWTVSIFTWTSFYVLYNALAFIFSYRATWILYPLLFWALTATATKRLHDTDRTAWWLLLIIIPVLGPLMLIWLLGFRKGRPVPNRFGKVPGTADDYFKNPVAAAIEGRQPEAYLVNDVTQLNPVEVAKVEAPATIGELQQIVQQSTGPLSTGGGRFSMGGQTASTNTTHIDMRGLNRVLDFSAAEKTITVEAGIRWCDIQRYVDPHGLSVKIMQTYANFTVGGSLSVNVHGRYIGLGPVILSVRAIELVLASGERVKASRTENSELFFASIGCYNAIGIIVTAELELEDNLAVKREWKKMKRTDYHDFFFNSIRDNKDVIFHNGDIYPPLYRNVRAVSWVSTTDKPTVKTRLMPLAAAYPIERYFIHAFSRSRFGKWRREYIIDPILYLRKKIHWRNYEAGYDVFELEPQSRKQHTYVLQEYFVPVDRFDDFATAMAAVFTRHNVNIINVSIRHAKEDAGSLLAWARQEVFAFVVWYKQATTEVEKNRVGVWTRELIDAAIALDGAYYLPYQAHATAAQFHKAYPRAQELFNLKARLDPDYRFRNILWDTYYLKQQT